MMMNYFHSRYIYTDGEFIIYISIYVYTWHRHKPHCVCVCGTAAAGQINRAKIWNVTQYIYEYIR